MPARWADFEEALEIRVVKYRVPGIVGTYRRDGEKDGHPRFVRKGRRGGGCVTIEFEGSEVGSKVAGTSVDRGATLMNRSKKKQRHGWRVGAHCLNENGTWGKHVLEGWAGFHGYAGNIAPPVLEFTTCSQEKVKRCSAGRKRSNRVRKTTSTKHEGGVKKARKCLSSTRRFLKALYGNGACAALARLIDHIQESKLFKRRNHDGMSPTREAKRKNGNDARRKGRFWRWNKKSQYQKVSTADEERTDNAATSIWCE